MIFHLVLGSSQTAATRTQRWSILQHSKYHGVVDWKVICIMHWVDTAYKQNIQMLQLDALDLHLYSS